MDTDTHGYRRLSFASLLIPFLKIFPVPLLLAALARQARLGRLGKYTSILLILRPGSSGTPLGFSERGKRHHRRNEGWRSARARLPQMSTALKFPLSIAIAFLIDGGEGSGT